MWCNSYLNCLKWQVHLASLVRRAHDAVGPGLVVCRGPGQGVAAAGAAAAAGAPGGAVPTAAVGLMQSGLLLLWVMSDSGLLLH